MKLKEKNFKTVGELNLCKNTVWSLCYRFLIWDFFISDNHTRSITFESTKEALEFQQKLLEIEIPLSKINFIKKEIYVTFEFPLDTKRRAIEL